MATPAEAAIGIDLGTSGVKVVVLGTDSRLLGRASWTYPLLRPSPGAAEADPEQWWSATVEAVRAALAQARQAEPGLDILGLGLSGQMHGLVLVDAAGEALRPAILWPDTRAASVLDGWRALTSDQHRRLGNPLVAGMYGPILAWSQVSEPDVVARAHTALLPKDWLRARLTGRLGTEPSDASGTLLWDVRGDGWAVDIVAQLGLPNRLLPEVGASDAAAGGLTASAADQLGLRSGLPVAFGAADTAASILGVGLGLGETLLSVGSGAQLVRLLDQPALEAVARSHTYRAADPDRWYAMAALQNCGLALDWVRSLLGAHWDALYTACAGDLDGLPEFHPYLTGERTPLNDELVRGSWTGLGLQHSRTDLLGSAGLGVALAIRHGLESLPGPAPDELVVVGGGARDPRMLQLLADVLGVPLTRGLDSSDAAATGAARLGLRAVGATEVYRARTPGAAAARPDPTRRATTGAAYERFVLGSLTDGSDAD